MSKILITGGAGYIGSHVAQYLQRCGREVVVLDDLSGGFRDAVRPDCLVEGSIGDRGLLDRIFTQHRITAVMNFASFIEVGASMNDPSVYYRNNVGNTLELLDGLARHGVGHLIFSSTAAIFGSPEYTPIDEAHPKAPSSPYGRSKWLIEQTLPDYERAYGLKSVSLRYFNAAGADPDGSLGERHQPETHLIPLVLQAAAGRREAIHVFGTDYLTPDGTCIRDYIHVEDLARAHLKALEYLESGARSAAFNLGNGQGFSVREVIAAVREVTGRSVQLIETDRRPGDPPILVADSRLARSTLGWVPEHAELQTIVAHAWAWEQMKGVKW
jgi:UDP-glucose 4-epimerase